MIKEHDMTKEIAVITVHGMGDTNPNYHHDLVKKTRKYVGKDTWDEKIQFESVFYQDLLQGNQEDYWNEIDDKYNLKWDFLRKFMLFSFSDAASIEHSLRNNQKLYRDVHSRIAKAFDNALEKLGSVDKPVIIIPHSLGGEQVTNYLWDAMHNKRFFDENEQGTDDQKAFRRMKSCKLLVTTGCNIPIFRVGLEEPKLFPQPNPDFEWRNYFDKHDVLAYPIKDMSDEFNVSWITDKEVSVGGLLSGWNPASHGQYWDDKDVVKPIAQEITNLL